MFLRSKESLRLSINSIKSCVGFSHGRDLHLTHCIYLRKVSSGRRKLSDVRDYESASSVAGEFSVIEPPKNINDNFFGIESDVGVIEIKDKSSLNIKARKQLFENVQQEKFITTTFGTVRYDSENKPMHHGQLENEKVVISSNAVKNKMHDLSQSLERKSTMSSHNGLSSMEKSVKTVTDELNRNLESKLPCSSYIDELYFSDPYTEKEDDKTSGLENSPNSSNRKINFIEESYFNDKTASDTIFKKTAPENIKSTDNNPFPAYEKSTEFIAEHNSSSFQKMSEVRNLPSKSVDDKSNFIEKCYFSDKKDEESNLKNMPSKLSDNSDKNAFLPKKSEMCISIDKQSSIFEDYYIDTISDNHRTSDEKRSTPKLVVEKNLVYENITESAVDKTDLQITSREAIFNIKNKSKIQESEANIKTLYDLNESTKEVTEDSEQISLQWNNLSLEELESYNKFMPGETNLYKQKNKFLFQSKEFLKDNELTNLKTPRLKKLTSLQRNTDEITIAEKIQDEKKAIKSLEKTQHVNAKDLNTNDQPETAYDFVKKLRSTKKKSEPELINGKFVQKNEQYDSKGFRILKNQVPDLKYYTRDEILDLLTKNILYSDDDLIILNKPYNLVMHESKTTKDPCVSQYLDDLAAQLDRKSYKPKLITVHRLDKETCGCLLLARNEISAQKLSSLFSQRKIVKTYWIVTTKVPNPLEGIIDMPISEGSINGRARMVLHPNLPKDIPYKNHSKSGKRAVTHYKVIAESGHAALVETKPETGIKHQIRVHFGFGLSCPILGDHKYSHLDKLAPQKLQSDLLQRLHVRQSKVRHIPMHIYARSILIPQYKDGRNLFVMAPMPTHMSKNLQKLKFKKN